MASQVGSWQDACLFGVQKPRRGAIGQGIWLTRAGGGWWLVQLEWGLGTPLLGTPLLGTPLPFCCSTSPTPFWWRASSLTCASTCWCAAATRCAPSSTPRRVARRAAPCCTCVAVRSVALCAVQRRGCAAAVVTITCCTGASGSIWSACINHPARPPVLPAGAGALLHRALPAACCHQPGQRLRPLDKLCRWGKSPLPPGHGWEQAPGACV